MKKFNFKYTDIRKFLGTIIGGIFFIYCILFFTYAYYEWKSGHTNVTLAIEDLNVTCQVGPDVNATNIGPVLNIEDGVKVDFSIENETSSSFETDIILNIDSISDELKVESFKYGLVVDVNGWANYNYDNYILEGDFDLESKATGVWDSEIGILNIGSISVAANSTYSYQFIVYIDGTVYNNSNMQGKSLIGSLSIGNCVGDNSSDSFVVNAPNLDSGNLIPVYYDDTVVASDGTYGVWKKADSTNSNNSWYDYNNKKWANAVIIGDSTRKNYYNNADAGTTITDEDITAFYVWIPRFKYRVWNITRQGGDESTYAYPAFTDGIDIKFETGISSTGNVECNYNVGTAGSASTLSDICVFNGTDTITVDSGNANYTYAWYTHPAFTFGNKEIEGFWIGKFETSTDTSSTCYTTPSEDNCNNTNQNPKILPDVSSLRNQNVSNQFTTAKKFQSYLSDVNAHMLTNLEWGAVTYLTHSIYGLCNGTTCQGVSQNNSSEFYTGRSGGDIAGSTNLNLTNVYGSNVIISATKYNSSGYYNYKGYKLDYSTGTPTTTKDISKVASTTGNVTGVYDISGGATEYVMGNMVNLSGAFYPTSAVTSGVTNPWNSSSILDNFYYNTYSYGINYVGAIAFNRARLGDAIAEVLGGTTSDSSWKVGSGITGSASYFMSGSGSWFYRGGHCSNENSGAFYFNYIAGASSSNFSFRSSLS